MFVQVKNLLCIALALVIVASAPLISVAAQTVDLPDGSKLDLTASCPVCNMKLEDSKLGVAAVVFKDGKVVGFDSAGDMFRYVLLPVKYSISTEKHYKHLRDGSWDKEVHGRKAGFLRSRQRSSGRHGS